MSDNWTIDDVVKFAHQRHAAWGGEPVSDPIVRSKKFTNVFRVLDRGSQYLIRIINAYSRPEDQLAFAYMYRQINSPSTTDAIIEAHGELPTLKEITDREWILDVLGRVWQASTDKSVPFLNTAYMILVDPGSKKPIVEKMADVFPAAKAQLLSTATDARSLEEMVHSLRRIHGVGDFLAMQIATDYGYVDGVPDEENDFILPGPGSKRGVAYLGTGRSPVDVIQTFPRHELPPLPHSNGRHASWMDVQNVFCEFSKYVWYKRRGGVPKDAPAYTRSAKPMPPVRLPAQFIH